jgi:ApeA N-terminal domain 1
MAKLRAPISGTFELAGDRVVFGSLLVAGRKSRLTLFDDSEFPPVPAAYRYLAGELHDGELVTLFDCVLESMKNRRMKESRVKSLAHIFPNTIIIGPRHVPREGECVSEISVLLKDAHSVFYDFDAFSTVLRPEPFVPLLKQDKAAIRSVEIGDNPIIGYFAGRHEIARFSSSFGRFSARHRVSETMGGPAGWRLDSQVAVSLGLDEPLAFKDAMRRVHALIRFFEFIIGRRQALKGVEIRLHHQTPSEGPLRVVEAYAPQAENGRYRERASPGPCDVLLCTVEGSEEFCAVAKNYFEGDGSRLDARVRLAENIRRNSYTVDRLVSAANMFDIFPKSCYPAAAALSDEVINARDDARKSFKSLPSSIERDSMLSALSRIDQMTLKKKVLARLNSSGILSKFSGLDDVLKEAVNCRNHYVHGSPGKIDYVRACSRSFKDLRILANAKEEISKRYHSRTV